VPETIYRALIVDDDDVSRYLAVNALGLLGFDCEEAEDGCIAIEMVRKNPYDVVITDLRMPIQNGHGLAVEILKLQCPPLVVVLTSVTEPRIVHDLMTRGVADVAFKPVPFPAFAAKIRSCLKKGESKPVGVGHLAQAANPQATSQESHEYCDKRPSLSAASAHNPANHGKHVALIMLNDVIRARELADRLSTETVHAAVARTNEELYQLVNLQRVDFLMIEEKQGGLISAPEILERMRSELLSPKTLLVAESGGKTAERASALGVVQTISPNASFKEMADGAERAIAAITESDEMIPRVARRLVQSCDRLPQVPQLLVKLVDYLRMDAVDVPVNQLAKHIAADSQATAELLRLINSASMGLRWRINSVVDAVHYLGAKRAISLILSSAASSGVSDLLTGWSNPFREWYQQRSVLIASTAAVFANRFEEVSEDTAFVLGLLQEIGILVLANSPQQQYSEKTLQRTREIPQFSLAAAEFADFQITHAEVSAAFLREWELPQSLIGPILHHHSADEQGRRSKSEQSLIRVMRIGEAFADLSDNPHPYRMRKLNILLAHYGTGAEALCRQCLSEATDRTTESCEQFSIPIPDHDVLRQALDAATKPHQVDSWQEASVAEDASVAIVGSNADGC
jgi:HD-like signal output (HDOD) protein/DNA-binding NarL/FixJ family response regulator